jgi:hypothetical protein
MINMSKWLGIPATLSALLGHPDATSEVGEYISIHPNVITDSESRFKNTLHKALRDVEQYEHSRTLLTVGGQDDFVLVDQVQRPK